METITPIQVLFAGPFVPETRTLHQLLTQQQQIAVVADASANSGARTTVQVG